MKKNKLFRLSSFLLILFSVLVLFSLSSCEKEPEPIGIGLEDEQLINTYFTDTMTVDVKVFQADSINTTGRTGNSRMLVGSLSDQYAGRYSAQSFGSLSLSNISEDLINNAGEVAIFDSLVAFFQTDYVYGDDEANHSIQVYQIAETFEKKEYFQFDSLQTESQVLGQGIYPIDLDSNQVLRVVLDQEFGQTLFDYGRNSNFSIENDSLFSLFAKGLALRTASPNTSIIGINSFAPNTRVALYFHYPEDTASSIYNFDFSWSFSTINSDLTGSAVAPLVNDNFIFTENTNDLGVVQAGTGIGAKLEFPYLKDFVKDRSIIIQRASLRIPTLREAMSLERTAPNQLLFLFGQGDGYFYNSEGNLQFVQSETNQNSGLSMSYTPAGRSYDDASLTNYINVLSKDTTNDSDGLILQPSENNITVNRFVFPTQRNTQNLDAIQLRIYYSIVE